MNELFSGHGALCQYGAPFLQRKEEIQRKVATPESYFPIEIMGRLHQIPVISVRIQMPVYRLENGRTKSLQLEYLSINKQKPHDLFTNDHDAIEAQSAQHELLSKLIKEENLLDSFKNEGLEQVEPIVCTNTGVVVNGNRRLCAWRTLYYADAKKYKNFETIYIAILPELDEKAISEIEKRLQIQKTMRAEYHWHTKALMAEEDLKKGGREADVAKSFGLKKKELHTLVEARKLAEQYLTMIGHPNEWSRIDKTYYAFDSIVVGSSRILDQNERELFKKLAFDLIKGERSIEDTATGRLYQAIKEYAENINAIAARMAENMKKNNELHLEQNQLTSASDEMVESKSSQSQPVDQQPSPNQTSYGIPNDLFSADDSDMLLGGEEAKADDASDVSNAIDSGVAISHSVIQNVIEVQKSLKGEKERSMILLNQISKASSYLQLGIDLGFLDETNIEGAEEQISELETRLNIIKDWIANRKK